MSEQPAVSTQPHAEVVWVTVQTQRMDEAASEALRREVAAASTRQPTLPVAVDLSLVEFVPSVALGALVGLNRDLRQAGRRFMLVGVQPLVRPVFSITRLDRLFEMHPTFDDAIGRLRESR